MIRTAVSVAPDTLLLLGVTVLTSANSETLREIGITDDVSHQVCTTGENLGWTVGSVALSPVRGKLARCEKQLIET